MPASRSELALPVAAILALLAGALGHYLDSRLPPVVWEGRDLVEGLDPRRITRIEIAQGSKRFGLQRQGDGFSVDSLGGAPASTEKVNQILLRLGGAQVSRVVGEEAQWDEFRVGEKNADLTVEVVSAGAKAPAKIFIGKYLPNSSVRAVRVTGKDEVFATAENLSFSTTDTDYLKRSVPLVRKDGVKAFEVLRGGSKVAEARLNRDGLLGVLEDLKVEKYFRTGTVDPAIANLEWKTVLSVTGTTGVLYQISFADAEGKWYARAEAQLNQSMAPGGSLDLSQLTAKADADRFNQTHLPWIWQLAEESSNQLTRGLTHAEEKQATVSKK
jgi:hypothetical protein